MDVFTGGQIHYRVRAPLRGPAHLLYFLTNARCHSAVADIGIDLHEKVATNNYRLNLRMVDVRGDDRATGSHFIPHKLGRDVIGNFRAKALARMLLIEHIAGALLILGQLHCLFAPEIFADGNELHLRRHNALSRIPKLRNGMSFSPQGLAA